LEKNHIIPDNIRFKLTEENEKKIRETPYEFGFKESGLGEVVFQRTYSRLREDGTKENWHDVVIRVINGIFTIRKWWYKTHSLKFEENIMQDFAINMAIDMTKMKWLPPGRGLFAMGTPFVYEMGAAAITNCALTLISAKDFIEDNCWMMEMLMYGCGVGFVIGDKPVVLKKPDKDNIIKFTIEDSREGWVDSIRVLLSAYINNKNKFPDFDYSELRPEGARLKRFGGTSSGPEPLRILHKRIEQYCDNYIDKYNEKNKIDLWIRLVSDIANAIGVAVIAGSIRRSAEINIYNLNDTFLNLKNTDVFPERANVSWMSNNSVRLWNKEDFLQIPKIAELIKMNGEPGIINMVNTQNYARFGKKKKDSAVGTNPCGEIPLPDKGVCNLVEVYPNNCENKQEFFRIIQYAAFYATTVSLLPTHNNKTNRVISDERRIGVSLTGIAQWIDTWGMAQCIRWMRDGYKKVQKYSKKYNKEAGVVEPIRTTTVKPAGTTSLITGCSSGMHWPIYSYAVRRMLLHKSNPLCQKLIDANYDYEPMLEILPESEVGNKEYFEKYKDFAGKGMVPAKSETSYIFEFPVHLGKARAASSVSAWEQFAMLATLQREWADNSVSCTISYNKSEESQIQYMLAQFLPVIKSVSILPLMDGDKKPYPQMPYEKINKDEFTEKISKIKSINWNNGEKIQEDKTATLYCESDKCTLQRN
jgi:ribonucleoside-triphosphate reductase